MMYEWIPSSVQKFKKWIKWKKRQERCLKLEVPKIVPVFSTLHVQTGNDVIVYFVILIYLITSYCRHVEITSSVATYITIIIIQIYTAIHKCRAIRSHGFGAIT